MNWHGTKTTIMTNPLRAILKNNIFQTESPQLILFLTLAIIFVDLLGASLVLPILPILFRVHGEFGGIGLSSQNLNILYGLLIATYPLAQLFGAPILGFYSDTIGRKKILILSLTGTALSYILSAISIATANLPLLFIARLLDGFTGGNVLIAQSIIADISTKENKSRNYGLINIAVALGTIFGPLIGGLSTEVKLIFDINQLASPFVLATIVVLINIVFLLITLKETNTCPIHGSNPQSKKLDIFRSFEKIQQAWKLPHLKSLFVVSFLSSLAFSLFINFFPKYLIDNFDYSPRRLGFITAYTGIWLVIIVLTFFTHFVTNTNLNKILKQALVIAGFTTIFLLLPTQELWFYLILPFLSGSLGLISPIITNSLSESVSSEKQGEILGINQSIQALGTLAPVLGGLMLNIWDKLPLLITGIIYLIAFWAAKRTKLLTNS